jgi:hypothetical protein
MSDVRTHPKNDSSALWAIPFIFSVLVQRVYRCTVSRRTMKGKRTMKRDSDFELIDGGKHLGARLIRIVDRTECSPMRTRCTAFFLRGRHAGDSILTDREQPGYPTRTRERELLSFSPCGRLLCPPGIVGYRTAHCLLIPLVLPPPQDILTYGLSHSYR